MHLFIRCICEWVLLIARKKHSASTVFLFFIRIDLSVQKSYSHKYTDQSGRHFIIVTLLGSLNSFCTTCWRSCSTLLSKNIFNYQLTTPVGLPAVLVKAKKWIPPDCNKISYWKIRVICFINTDPNFETFPLFDA